MRKIFSWIGLILLLLNTSCAFGKSKSSHKKAEPAKLVYVEPKHEEKRHDEEPSEPKTVFEQKGEHVRPQLHMEEEERHEKPAHKGPHWSYEGKTGPKNWGKLGREYKSCASGKEQSPINITNGKTKDIGNIRFYYKASKLNIVNNGHTIQVDYDKGSSIRIDGERYELIQFHFHTPSEHTIDGSSYPMELHLVHKNKAGKLAVVGVMMVLGKYNRLLAPLWENLPSKEGTENLTQQIDMSFLLPAGERTFRYPGSLTTPPCSESVKWNVLLSPISISNQQLLAFRDIFKKNNRPVQKLGKRVLWEDTTP